MEVDDENERLRVEVEDIMCDQGIITAELNMDINTSSTLTVTTTRIRVIAVIAETILPAVIGVYYAYLRNQKTVVESVRRQILPTVFAFLANSISRSLSSVQRGITYPLTLRSIKQPNSSSSFSEEDDNVDKCVECVVLHEPPKHVKVVTDVIFIHGIHGSLINTWKQGLWQSNRSNIKKAILERRNSDDDYNVYVPRTQVKRLSSDFSSSPNKLTKIENIDVFVTGSQDDDVVEETEADRIEEDEIDYSKCWPKDWLSKDFPNSRVIALNYTTDPHLWRPVWVKKRNRSGLVERSKEMIDHLLKIGVGNNPIVWVGHSKGGLYVKQILIQSWESCEDIMLQNLYLQSRAIMFYSVPHRGSSLASFTLPFLSRSIELLEVQKDCHFVLNLHEKFLKMLENTSFPVNIFSFIETSLTLMSFMFVRIVAVDSADPGIGKKWGIPLDHREICKPSSKNCFLYKELQHLIQKVLDQQ